MISYFKGIIIEKTPVMVVLECRDIAFEIYIPLSTYEKLPLPGSEIKLYIYLNVSEDNTKMYGFISSQDKELFNLLISVNGIGPKLALSVLSSMTCHTFIKYIRCEDENALTIVPGLGKKTARRLILEIKDKIEKTAFAAIGESAESSKSQQVKEAESALLTLGYRLSDIRPTLNKLEKNEDIKSPEQLIKMVIKHLHK